MTSEGRLAGAGRQGRQRQATANLRLAGVVAGVLMNCCADGPDLLPVLGRTAGQPEAALQRATTFIRLLARPLACLASTPVAAGGGDSKVTRVVERCAQALDSCCANNTDEAVCSRNGKLCAGAGVVRASAACLRAAQANASSTGRAEAGGGSSPADNASGQGDGGEVTTQSGSLVEALTALASLAPATDACSQQHTDAAPATPGTGTKQAPTQAACDSPPARARSSKRDASGGRTPKATRERYSSQNARPQGSAKGGKAAKTPQRARPSVKGKRLSGSATRKHAKAALGLSSSSVDATTCPASTPVKAAHATPRSRGSQPRRQSPSATRTPATGRPQVCTSGSRRRASSPNHRAHERVRSEASVRVSPRAVA